MALTSDAASGELSSILRMDFYWKHNHLIFLGLFKMCFFTFSPIGNHHSFNHHLGEYVFHFFQAPSQQIMARNQQKTNRPRLWRLAQLGSKAQNRTVQNHGLPAKPWEGGNNGYCGCTPGWRLMVFSKMFG